MIIETIRGVSLDSQTVGLYFSSLVNSYFKILPMRESKESSLVTYMTSLQVELLGFKELFVAVGCDPMYITLLSILQFLIDNPETPVSEVKREVFRAISICNKLGSRYSKE